MNQSINPNPQTFRASRTFILALVFLLMLVVFAWVYYFEPLSPYSEYWNDKVCDTLTLIPALIAAILGIQLTRQFKPSEPPYRIWLTFTIGWWFWVGGELLGFVYDAIYMNADYPEITLIDLCWVLGYIFFGLSLYYQFRLIYNWKSGRKSVLYLAFIGIALAVTLGLTQWALVVGLGKDISWFALYLAILYPVFDLFEGGAALWLFFLFGRGYLGRPWWGLIAFAVADSINIFFWIGGSDWLPEKPYLLIDLFSSVAYVAGYMITALAFFSAIGHIQSGMSRSDTNVPPSLPTASPPA
jgi:hypothetical protein